MSIIAFKITKDAVTVAADGRVINDDYEILSEDFTKIFKLSDSLIIGCTGLADSNSVYKRFVETKLSAFEYLEDVASALPLFVEFKEYVSSNFGYSDSFIAKEFGGFLVINKKFQAVFYFGDRLTPYATGDVSNTHAFGTGSEYAKALLDYGLSPYDAISFTSRKYISVNNNITQLTLNLK